MISLTYLDPMVRHHARLIERLSLDLERVRLGTGPSREELDAAPVIDAWQPGMRAEPALIGHVTGHPHVSGQAITSSLHFIDRDLGYARTLSRWYRLGSECK